MAAALAGRASFPGKRGAGCAGECLSACAGGVQGLKGFGVLCMRLSSGWPPGLSSRQLSPLTNAPPCCAQIRRMVLDGQRPEVPPPDALPGPAPLQPAHMQAYCQLMRWVTGAAAARGAC